MRIDRRAFITSASAVSLLPFSLRAAESHGASESILKFLAAVRSSGHELHSVMIAQHGQTLAQGWWAPYRPDAVHLLYSLTKSFTSTAVGFAVGEGLLRVSDSVTRFFPQDLPPTVSKNLAALRVEHLLTMSAGHENETNAIITTERDWVKAFLRCPIEHEPGTRFFYDSGATYMLSAIVQKVTGKPLADYLQPRLFQPLGIRDFKWERCPLGINVGGWGLSVTTESIQRFGQLYLQHGIWEGRPLLQRSWVDQATSFKIQQQPPNPTSDWNQGYAYLFWRCRHNAFRGDGAFGQFCIVLPEQDAVVAITSSVRDMQAVLNLVWDNLLPALSAKSGSRDTATQGQLKSELASLTLPLPVSTARPAASNRTFALEPNSLGAESVSIEVDETACAFKLKTAGGTSEIRAGFGRWLDGITAMPGTPPSIRDIQDPKAASVPRQIKVAAAAGWKDPGTLELKGYFYETPHHDTVTCRFDGNRLTVDFMNSITQLQGAASHPETRPTLKGTLTNG